MNRILSRFPRLYLVYNQFRNGSLQLAKDARTKLTVRPVQGEVYTTEQLVTHHEFVADIKRCLPIFVIFWIPFVGMWIALPFAFLFPQQTLSRQFWTDTQRQQALDKTLHLRMEAYTPLAEQLIKSIDTAKVDHKLTQVSCDIIEQVSRGRQLERNEAMFIRRLFSEVDNLHIPNLSRQHQKYLACSLGSHDLHGKAVHLANVDQSLLHFGIHKQSSKYLLDMICHQRGLLLENRDIDDCKQYLREWTSLTKIKYSQASDLGYFLHLPMLMRNNCPKTNSNEQSSEKKAKPG